METESEVTLPDALAWLKSLSGDYAAKIAKHINEQMKENTLLRSVGAVVDAKSSQR